MTSTPITPELIENWSEQAAFCASINSNPDDPFPHLVAFADWMSERGDVRELGLRWLVREGKVPELNGIFWDWWKNHADKKHTLPLSIECDDWFLSHATLAAAYLSAAQALVDQGEV